MGYRLGVDLGTTFTAAVLHRPELEDAPTVFPLGDRAAAIPSVLYLGADGTVLMGEAAERRALTDPDRVVRRFKRRIGDETPLLVGPGGQGLTAHAIAARMIGLVADRVAAQEGAAPDAVAVTVPATWGAHKKDLLLGALAREGLLDVTLVSEPTAAALAYVRTGRVGTGCVVAVYDFGGGTFDAAVLRAQGGTTFAMLGTPTGLPDLGGIDFDDAVLAYVLGTVGPQTPGVETDDAMHVTAMARLRRECVDAKEALSADTVVTVPVLLGGAQTSVRLTRSDFEAMIAGAVEETCTAVEATLVSANLTSKNLDRILLTGGSSRIPLVTQLLSARYPGVALERDIDPKLAVAIGGVLALEQPGSGGRHAAPRPVTAMAPATPARPALELESFDRERELAAAGAGMVTQRRRTPSRLVGAAGVVLLAGFGLTQSGLLDLSEALPANTLQEARAGTPDDSPSLQVEAVGDAKVAGPTEKNKKRKAGAGLSRSAGTGGAATAMGGADTSVFSDNSVPTASGRTEGSAPSRSAESSGTASRSDATAGDGTSARSSGASTGGDQASTERKAAKRNVAAPATGTPAAAAPATERDAGQGGPQEKHASGTAAKSAPGAAPEAVETEEATTQTGSVEFKNDGPGEETP